MSFSEHLANVASGQEFRFPETGDCARNLHELCEAAKRIDENSLNAYLEREDFSSWIKFALGDDELSEHIMHVNEKCRFIAMLEEAIERTVLLSMDVDISDIKERIDSESRRAELLESRILEGQSNAKAVSEALGGKIADAQARLERIEKAIKQSDALKAELECEIAQSGEESRSKRKKISRELKSTEEKIESLEKRVLADESESSDSEKRLISQIGDKAKALKKTLDSNLQGIKEKLDAASRKDESIEKELNDSEKKLDSEIAQLSEKVLETQSSISRAQKRGKKIIKAIEEKEKNMIAGAEERIGKAEKGIKDAEIREEALAGEIKNAEDYEKRIAEEFAKKEERLKRELDRKITAAERRLSLIEIMIHDVSKKGRAMNAALEKTLSKDEKSLEKHIDKISSQTTASIGELEKRVESEIRKGNHAYRKFRDDTILREKFLEKAAVKRVNELEKQLASTERRIYDAKDAIELNDMETKKRMMSGEKRILELEEYEKEIDVKFLQAVYDFEKISRKQKDCEQVLTLLEKRLLGLESESRESIQTIEKRMDLLLNTLNLLADNPCAKKQRR